MYLKLPDFMKRFDVKLTIFHIVIIILLFTVLSFYYYYGLKNNLVLFVDKVLSDESVELVQEIQQQDNEGHGILEGCRLFMNDTSEREHYSIYFRLFGHNNTLVFESDNLDTINLPSIGDPTERVLLTLSDKRHLRLHVTRIKIDKSLPEYTLQIATITEHADTILRETLKNVVLISPIILILSIFGSIYVSRQSSKVIKQITMTAKNISSSNLSERLPVPETYNEIRELIIASNLMLDRLENDFLLTRQFSSDVSHELRTPLFALKGQMEVALSQNRSGYEYRETFSNCVERTDRMIRMVNDLFLITRYESNKINMDIEPVDLNELITEIHEFYLPAAQEKKISFRLMLEPNVKSTLDKTKILQLLNNLIENAIHYTPSGGEIVVFLSQLEADVEIKITDTGIGIPENELQNVFNRFYQVDRSRSGKNRGTGLGLQICERIVKAHNGTIEISQVIPTGTKVIVRL